MLPRSAPPFVAGLQGKKMFRNGVFALLLALTPVFAGAAQWQAHAGIAALFAQTDVRGTFVVVTPDGVLLGHDEARARTRFVPASSFKIANTLIGLARNTVRDLDEVLPWDGQPQPFPQWEREMSLREAFPISNVPVFQELARRTGLDTYRKDLARLGYGNATVGERVDRFWLDGPLAISAVEQVEFLARLAAGTLPYPPGAQRSVRVLARMESGPGWALYGKTGWQNAPQPGVGWWVGWVECGRRTYPFALNLDIGSTADAELRMALGRASLQAAGVLPCR
jgi:beta-lactamase class D